MLVEVAPAQVGDRGGVAAVVDALGRVLAVLDIDQPYPRPAPGFVNRHHRIGADHAPTLAAVQGPVLHDEAPPARGQHQHAKPDIS